MSDYAITLTGGRKVEPENIQRLDFIGDAIILTLSDGSRLGESDKGKVEIFRTLGIRNTYDLGLKCFTHYPDGGIHPWYEKISTKVSPVSVEAKPAPAPERINLWNAVNNALYDFPKGNGVECADRVVGALERDKPTVLCVGNVLYYRQDKAIQDAKELRERAATLISSLRTVVDECMERIHRPKVRRATVSGLAKPKRKPAKKTAKKGGRKR